MRRYIGLCLVVAAGACGGETSSPNPPPPPPAAPGPPASVTIQAGDNQEANPGSTVANVPTVLVKDAQNRAVPNVTVTFAVETGGGSLASSSASTGSDGTAASGAWTLGAVEGPNTIKATVGALQAATFRATGKFLAATVADTTVPVTESVITYAKPGSPLHGMTLTIPNGAYSAPGKWQIRTESSGSVVLPAGIKPSVPIISIRTDRRVSDSLLFLKIPVRTTPDSVAVAFYYDETSRRLELIPPAAADGTSLTIATTHFNGDLMFTPSAGAAARLRADEYGKPIRIVIVTEGSPILNQPVITGFLPGLDDWEFRNLGSYIEPGGICSGQSLSAIYAYLVQKSSITYLFNRFDVLKNRWEDNPEGYKLASMVQLGTNWVEFAVKLKRMNEYGLDHGVDLDLLHYSSLVVGMRLNKQPQMVGIRGPAGGHAVVAYKAVGGAISVADPNYPGQERTINFTGGKFEPFAISLKSDDPAYLFPEIRTAGASAFMDKAKLDELWGRFTAKTIGKAEFPPYQLQWRDAEGTWTDVPEDGKVVTFDEDITFRTLCQYCERQSRATGAVNTQQWTTVFDGEGAMVAADSASTDQATFDLEPGISKLGVNIRGGRVKAKPAPDNISWAWVDWRWLEVTSAQLAISPKQLTADVDKPYDFTVDDHGLAKEGWKFVWSVNDESAPVTQTEKTFVKSFSKFGEFTVKVELKNPAGRIVGKATSTVTLGTPKPYWRLETFERVSGGSVGYEEPAFEKLRADPHRGLIYVNDPSHPVWVQWAGVYLQIDRGNVPVEGFMALAIDIPSHNSHFTNTGTLTSGTIEGNHCAYVGPSNTIASCARNNIEATKDGAWLRGRMWFTPSTDPGNIRVKTEYRFTARWP